MPELPEVEVLVRHLAPLVRGRGISAVEIRRPRVLGPTPAPEFIRTLEGATFTRLLRRGKYLVFSLRPPDRSAEPIMLVGHLGMTGRMYLLPRAAELPKHAAVVLELGRQHRFVYEDPRYFGRLTLDRTGLDRLGPEPLADDFTPAVLAAGLRRSAQAVKIKLLDQSLVAGVGNIYASEALFQAGISPRLAARRLKAPQIDRLHAAIREVLTTAIAAGSTLPLDFSGQAAKTSAIVEAPAPVRGALFYYGTAGPDSPFYQERLQVYDRRGEPCVRCAAPIRRLIQAARSTFFCPRCQRA